MWNSPLGIHLSGEETPENQGSGHELSALALHSRKSAKQYLGLPLPVFSSMSRFSLPVQGDPPPQLEMTPTPPLSVFFFLQKNEVFALVWNHLEDEKLETERLRGRTVVSVLEVFQHLFQMYVHWSLDGDQVPSHDMSSASMPPE